MSAARRTAIRELFVEMGERLAVLLDEDGERTEGEGAPPAARHPRKLTELDKARADKIARRLGR